MDLRTSGARRRRRRRPPGREVPGREGENCRCAPATYLFIGIPRPTGAVGAEPFGFLVAFFSPFFSLGAGAAPPSLATIGFARGVPELMADRSAAKHRADEHAKKSVFGGGRRFGLRSGLGLVWSGGAKDAGRCCPRHIGFCCWRGAIAAEVGVVYTFACLQSATTPRHTYVCVCAREALIIFVFQKRDGRSTSSVLPPSVMALAVGTVGADCPYINVTLAGDSSVNGLYALSAEEHNGKPRWTGVSGGGGAGAPSIEYNTAAEADGWFGAGTGALYALIDKSSHKYIAKLGATSKTASAPIAGWQPRSKKAHPRPAPTLACASLPPSCSHARVLVTGAAPFNVAGSLLSRQCVCARSAASGGGDGGVAATFIANTSSRWPRTAQVLVDWADAPSASKWFGAPGAVWGAIAPDPQSGQPKHAFIANDDVPLSTGPPLRGWRARSTKHHTSAKGMGPAGLALEQCVRIGAVRGGGGGGGGGRALCRVVPRRVCAQSLEGDACTACRCAACGLCPPPPPMSPSPPFPPPPPRSPSPPPPPPRPTQQLLMSNGFEDGGGGVEVSDSGGGGGGKMAWELPSRAAKRAGGYGLRIDVQAAYDPPWKARVALGSFWAVGGLEQLAVSFFARAEAADRLPSPHLSVTDIDQGYQWLGAPDGCALSATEWRLCAFAVPLDASRKGHALDVAIVVGHTVGILYVDDITVAQQLAPPPAPPAPSPPAPPLTPILLHEDFEALPPQPWPPPELGSPDFNARYGALASPVHALALPAAASSGSGARGGGGGKARQSSSRSSSSSSRRERGRCDERAGAVGRRARRRLSRRRSS